MATKRRTIKSRRETISARKKRRSLLNPLQRELDKPLAKSFKEGAAVAAVVAGPGKFGKGAAKITQKIKALRKARAAKAPALPKPGTKAFKKLSTRKPTDPIPGIKKNAALTKAVQKKLDKKVAQAKKDRAQFRKEDKQIDRAIRRANAAEKNPRRLARIEKARIKDLRARSKASVDKNVAERTALRKKLEAQTKAQQLRIKERNKIKTLRARSKASVKKNVAERKALRKATSARVVADPKTGLLPPVPPSDATLARKLAVLKKAGAKKPGKGKPETFRKFIGDVQRKAAKKKPSAAAQKKAAANARRNLKVNKAERQARIKAERLPDKPKLRDILKADKSKKADRARKRIAAKAQKEINRAKIGGKVSPAKIARITDKVLRESGINPRTLPGGGAKFTGRISKGRKRKGPKFE